MQNHKLAGRAQSVKKSTVRMVENHLAKQRNAYDAWIQELCSDAEESAAERDRLKAKLMKLREEHKRKMVRRGRVRFASPTALFTECRPPRVPSFLRR